MTRSSIRSTPTPSRFRARFLAQLSPVVVLLAAGLPLPAAAQEAEPVVIGERLALRSEILDEERTILVYRPAGYDVSSARYPVLYLLDGDAHFHHVSGVVDFLASVGRIPPMLVVGVANTDRTRDLTPPTREKQRRDLPPFADDSVTFEFPTAGGADPFLRFLTEELAPFVEERYRTASFRMLAGHSFGGLFAVHALLARPDAYDALIVVSPSLWWDDGSIPASAPERLAAQQGSDPRFLYLTVGDQEGDMVGPLHDFVNALEQVEPEGLRWWYRVMPTETHGSVPHRTLYDGLEAIFEDYAFPQVLTFSGDMGRIEAHFDRASRAYGYEIRPSEELLNRIGYAQLQLERTDKAVALFRRNVELYPESANVYDSLADALEASGELEEALRHREQAVRRARALDDPRLDAFRRKLDALEERTGGR